MTVRLAFLAPATLALVTTSADAKSDQIRRAPPPAWATMSDLLPVPENAGGPVFIRRHDVLVHVDQQGQSEYTGYRIRILSANALQIGNLSIAWNPAAGTPIVHAVNVIRGGQVIDVLKSTSFEILRREDQLEAARLDGTLTAVIRVPDLRVGDELEFGVTTPSVDPTLGKNVAGLLLLGQNPAPGRYRLGLSWEKGRKPDLKMTPDMAAAKVDGAETADFRFDNPATKSPPKDAPPRYQWQRLIEYSTFADWASVSRHFAPLYVKAAKLAPKSPLRTEIANIAAAHSAPLDRASASLKLVQQDVRYIYVGLNGGNLTPASADETWERRYGDCKAKTALLLSILKELGIEAEAVLVNTSGADDGLDQRLPSPQMFDHVIVRARIGGADYWLDGTLPPVVPPGAEPFFPLGWVLPLAEQGKSLERLAWQPATLPEEVTLHEIDARAGFDKPARIVNTSIARGIKGLQQQLQFSSVPPDQLASKLRQDLIGETWQSIDDVKWRYDIKAAASILTITGTGKVDWEDDGDGAKSLALPGGGFSPPEKRVRSTDQDQDLPFYNKPGYSCHVTTVRLPTATQARQWSSKPGYDNRIFGRNYYRAFELRDGAIRMVRGSRIERQEIEALAARKDNDRIAGFDNSMAWIFFNPADRRNAFGSGQHVPATYEIDWTASGVPCISQPVATK